MTGNLHMTRTARSLPSDVTALMLTSHDAIVLGTGGRRHRYRTVKVAVNALCSKQTVLQQLLSRHQGLQTNHLCCQTSTTLQPAAAATGSISCISMAFTVMQRESNRAALLGHRPSSPCCINSSRASTAASVRVRRGRSGVHAKFAPGQ